MTHYFCIDFDGTLTDSAVNAYVKELSDRLKNNDRDTLKIGIVTARSISDDFKTDGQFVDEIETLLEDRGIKLDFICTRYCLHVINPDHYATSGIAGAIKQAQTISVFGNIAVDYLAYRSNHQSSISQLRQFVSPTREYCAVLEDLYTKTHALRTLEKSLHSAHIAGKMIGADTPKVNQINTILNFYAGKNNKVLLLDDAEKHVHAINSHQKRHWQGVLYNDNFNDIKSQLSTFIDDALVKHHQPYKGTFFTRMSSLPSCTPFKTKKNDPICPIKI